MKTADSANNLTVLTCERAWVREPDILGLDSWPLKQWNNRCFKPLSFGVICYIVIGNWYNTLAVLLFPSFFPSFIHSSLPPSLPFFFLSMLAMSQAIFSHTLSYLTLITVLWGLYIYIITSIAQIRKQFLRLYGISWHIHCKTHLCTWGSVIFSYFINLYKFFCKLFWSNSIPCP